MTQFTPHSVETAPEGSKEALQGLQDALGFVPNLFGNMAESPALVEAYMALAGSFGKADLSETERQVIMMTNNRLNGCVYCMAGHTVLAKKGGVPVDVIEALRNNTPIADTKLEALRQFSIVMNETRGQPSQADIEAFLNAGYTKKTIFEMLIGMSLKLMSNYTNHIAQTPLDDAFAPEQWSPAQAAAA